VETEDGFYIGFHSFLDEIESVRFDYFPKNDHLISALKNDPYLQRMLFLTNGWYILQEENEGISIRDLRFSSARIPAISNTAFNFNYHLKLNNSKNKIVGIERNTLNMAQRSAGLDDLWIRIQGKAPE